jgi:hypothetical protein
MSIRKMIALHPKDQNNQALADAVHHLMYCSKMCLSCADACMAEPMDIAPTFARRRRGWVRGGRATISR